MSKSAGQGCKGQVPGQISIQNEPRIKLLDNVVYELVIHIYQKIVYFTVFGHDLHLTDGVVC